MNYSRKLKHVFFASILCSLLIIATRISSALALSPTGWAVTIIDNGSTSNSTETGFYPSTAIVNGTPAVAYFAQDNNLLMYARSAEPNGQSWGAAKTVIDFGDYNSLLYLKLMVIDDKPAIVYVEAEHVGGQSFLKFIRASDSSGSSWTNPVTIGMNVSGNSFSTSGYDLEVSLIQGNPTVVYKSGGQLQYIRANDSNGNTWGATTTIATGHRIAEDTSLTVIDGKPAISYREITGYLYPTGPLKFVIATDAYGSNWSTPSVVDPVFGASSSLFTFANGLPAIVYIEYHPTTPKIKLARADSMLGTVWSTTQTIATNASTITQPEFINDTLVLAYTQFVYDGRDKLNFVTSQDPNGITWEAPTIIDTVASSANQSSLVIANSQPAVGYLAFDYDSDSFQLKFARMSHYQVYLPLVISTQN